MSQAPTIFWDFDGTLAHSPSIWGKSLHEALIAYGYDLPLDIVRHHLRKGYSWHMPEIAYPDSTGEAWWQTLFNHIHKLYAAHGIPRDYWALVDDELQQTILDPENYTLYPDTKDTLRACQELGYHNHILSNNYPELPQVIERLEIAAFFSGYTVSGLVGYEKPRMELFRHALEAAGNPLRTVMVGDNPVADIQGGSAIGMATIWVHGEGECLSADYRCATLAEIPPLLKVLC